LEQQVIPCFYDRDADGLPKAWINRMMQSISTLAWRFSSHRMVADYTEKSYVWAAGGVTRDLRYR
jgi:starch phosphorylase